MMRVGKIDGKDVYEVKVVETIEVKSHYYVQADTQADAFAHFRGNTAGIHDIVNNNLAHNIQNGKYKVIDREVSSLHAEYPLVPTCHGHPVVYDYDEDTFYELRLKRIAD